VKTPRAEISVNGKPVASIFNERLISVTIVDKEGVTSDTVACELNDGNPFADIPRKGDIITVSLGYLETGVLDFGRYIADDPEVQCLPYKLSVNGKGTDMREKLKQHGARHWDKKTVKDIVSDIAKDHELTAKVDGKVGGYTYDWFGQEDESDIHVVERLARRHDALFSIKNGSLIFAAKGSGQSSSGAALTPVIATPVNIVAETCKATFAHRNSFARVKAHAQNRKTA
jgi:phage protein D